MRYDTSCTGKMVDHYRELKQYSSLSWVGGIDSDKALRYCINLIDPESEIYRITDIENRTARAAELAGFTRSGKAWSKPVQEAIDGFDDNVNEMMFTLMGIYHQTIFEMWYSSKISMHHIMKNLRMPPKDLNSKQLVEETKTRVAIEKELNSMITEQMSRESKIFRDSNLSNKVAGIVMGKMANYPEMYAEEPS